MRIGKTSQELLQMNLQGWPLALRDLDRLGQVAKRPEHKEPLEESGVGNLKSGSIDEPLTEEQDIDVDRAGLVLFLGAFAELNLNLLQRLQKILR